MCIVFIQSPTVLVILISCQKPPLKQTYKDIGKILIEIEPVSLLLKMLVRIGNSECLYQTALFVKNFSVA